MTIIADTPEGSQNWPDIRTVPGTRSISPDLIAYSLAHAAGQQLVVRVEQPGRGPLVYVHPRLLKAVQAWYENVPHGLAQIADTLLEELVTAPRDDRLVVEATETEGDSSRPCSQFAWCDGHEQVFPESDGAHMTRVTFGAYEGGEPKYVHAIRYLPVEEGDEPAHWSFSMPEGGEWSFGPLEVDAEIAAEIEQLENARAAIKAFLAENDRFDPDDDGGDLL